MGFGHQEELRGSKNEATDCFVAIDIQSLTVDEDSAPTARHWSKLQKTFLTRKGSQRQRGGEVKVVDGDTPADLLDKPMFRVLKVGEKEHGGQLLAEAVRSPITGGGGAGRRMEKHPSAWREPRRVLFLFATMSSMGTLVLLYLTLSLSKMTGADLEAR